MHKQRSLLLNEEEEEEKKNERKNEKVRDRVREHWLMKNL